MADEPTYDISQYTDALEDAKENFEAAVKGKDVRRYIASQCDATIDLANAINDNLNDAVEMSLAVPDTTLTQEGKPAEAKAAGEAINAKADNYDCEIYNSISMQRNSVANIGQYSVALNGSVASATNSVAINGGFATGNSAVAIGQNAMAVAAGSVAVGKDTFAGSADQVAVGKHNEIDDQGAYVYVVGCGTNTTAKNAQTVDSSGNTWIRGTIKTGGTGYSDSNAKTVATIEDLPPGIIVEQTINSGSQNAVAGGAVYTALQGKEPALTWDTTPTFNSSNPVTSGGVWSAIQNGASVITGTFTARLTESAGSGITVKQIGNIVYLQGAVGAVSTLAEASSHHIGDITGVTPPSSTVMIPCIVTDSADTKSGYLILANGGGSVYVAMAVDESMPSLIVNGFYFI